MISGMDVPDVPDTHYLDNRIFTNAGIFSREQKEIFAKVWLFVCHESEIAAPGDYRTLSAAGKPAHCSKCLLPGESFGQIKSQQTMPAINVQLRPLVILDGACLLFGNVVCGDQLGVLEIVS
jgi:hypothetical protein